MEYIKIDLAQIPQFFRNIQEVCNLFCERQALIDGAFNAVQATWRDKNAVITCNSLKETAWDIAKLYQSLNDAIEYVARVCNNRADYINYDRIAPPQIEPFRINIMEITNMDDSIISTHPDALEEFKNALDKYIGAIADNVERLIGIYNDIGSSWDDAQYERLGDAIVAFRNQMQIQVDVLNKISAFLAARIEILRRGDI